MTAKTAGRSTRRYKTQKRVFRAQCEDDGLPCWLCGDPIDYTLPYPHPESFSLDHAKTRTAHMELAEDPGNFRPSHLDCNKRRGDRDPAPGLGVRSEDW